MQTEKVYHNRETEEEKEQRKKEKRQGRNLQRVLATVVRESREERLQPKRDRKPLKKDQCIYCKERDHWAQECPNKWKPGARNPRPWEMHLQMAKVLALGEDCDSGRWGLDPLPEPRVTLKVEGKPTYFLVDTGAQHSILLRADGPVSSKKKSWVQGATCIKMYSWTTRRTVNLGMGRVSH